MDFQVFLFFFTITSNFPKTTKEFVVLVVVAADVVDRMHLMSRFVYQS